MVLGLIIIFTFGFFILFQVYIIEKNKVGAISLYALLQKNDIQIVSSKAENFLVTLKEEELIENSNNQSLIFEDSLNDSIVQNVMN